MIGSARCLRKLLIFGLLAISLSTTGFVFAQGIKSEPAYPSHLPYRFSNLVWWSDSDLGALLKKRIAGSGDELPTNNEWLGKVRDALTALLKEKGISAEVQSDEPSPSAFFKGPSNLPLSLASQIHGGPKPAIVFSALTPKVFLGKVTFEGVPEDTAPALESQVKGFAGRPYALGANSFFQERLVRSLTEKGYLDADVRAIPLGLRKDGEAWVVDVLLAFTMGAQYRVAYVTVDGGRCYKGGILQAFCPLSRGTWQWVRCLALRCWAVRYA